MNRCSIDIVEVPLCYGKIMCDGEPIAMYVKVGGSVGWYEEPFDAGEEEEG